MSVSDALDLLSHEALVVDELADGLSIATPTPLPSACRPSNAGWLVRQPATLIRTDDPVPRRVAAGVRTRPGSRAIRLECAGSDEATTGPTAFPA